MKKLIKKIIVFFKSLFSKKQAEEVHEKISYKGLLVYRFKRQQLIGAITYKFGYKYRVVENLGGLTYRVEKCIIRNN